MTKDTTDKGLFSRMGGHYGGGRYGYPPSYVCTPCPPSGGHGYPSAGYPPVPAGYPPPMGYPYSGPSHHSGYGSNHMAAAYGMQHHAHGGHHVAYGHHGYGHHGKFKHGKFGKHGMFEVKFKKWK